jgi:acetoacetyl-CoA reductase/3-oxoacyl-[acyl-carrier protein] reductase
MILITGASRGIGKFLFDKLKDDNVVFGTCHTTPIEGHEYTSVNIAELDSVSAWINQINPSKITLLNCAGVNYNAFAHKSDPLEWTKVIATNLVGTFNTISAVLPIMRNEGYGRIINFSSVVAQRGVVGTSAYSASKSALWGLTKTIAVENASKGITINNLNLGYFDIGMIDQVPDEMKERISQQIPVKRLGDPVNIYNAVDFLMKSDYITGTNIDINGGLF